MALSSEHKEEVGKKIMLQIVQGLRDNKLTIPELTYICSYLLETIEKITTEEQLITLLEELTANWDIFNPLLTIERGQKTEEQSQQQVQEISQLLKEQKVDEAYQKLGKDNANR